MSQDPPLPLFKLAGVKVWDASSWFPTMDVPGARVAFHRRDKSQVTGLAIHHDAVAFEGGDRNFDGQTWDEEKGRMQASYNYHTKHYPGYVPAGDSGWNWPGMGYQMYCFPSGRIYEVGGLRTVRAHVAHRNTPLVGIVGAGDFTTQRPAVGLQLAYASASVYVWAWSGRVLPIDPHREWAVEGWETACPGDSFTAWMPKVRRAADIIAKRQDEDADTRIRAALQPAWDKARWQFLHDQLAYIGFE